MQTGQSAHFIQLSAPLGSASVTESFFNQSHSPGAAHITRLSRAGTNTHHFVIERDNLDWQYSLQSFDLAEALLGLCEVQFLL